MTNVKTSEKMCTNTYISNFLLKAQSIINVICTDYQLTFACLLNANSCPSFTISFVLQEECQHYGRSLKRFVVSITSLSSRVNSNKCCHRTNRQH